MTWAALAFASGAALLQLQGALPSLAWTWLLPVLAAAALVFRRFAWVFCLGIGFLWALLLAHPRMDERIAPALEGKDLEVVGVIASLPAAMERGVRFEFEVESVEGGARLPKKILLSWYRSVWDEEDPALLTGGVRPGERWSFTVRLRRPHGNVNPHGFDYEAWLMERGIGATGYVRGRPAAPRLLGMRGSLLDRIEAARGAVRERFLSVLGQTPAAGILVALAVGDQRAIPSSEWRLFNQTGVTHLMSISGLHVTLVSGLFAWLVAFGWRRVPALTLRVPARKAAAIAAAVGALGYTLLAGFAVPAQRTFYMVAVVAAALWCGRIASPMRVLALALAAVVLADPWAPLAPGLWLSFGAVFLIFYVAQGWSAEAPRIEQWARLQGAVTVALAPAALLLFGQVSVAGPLANALAIPLVSVVVTPLALAAAAVPFDALLVVAAWLVELLMQFLEFCATLPGALWQQHVPALWTVGLALAGAAWLVAPPGIGWRACGIALMAPAFLLPPPAPKPGEAWITTFDVGQGLAVLVRTERRALLYDAGPAYGPEADSGGRVILPALRGDGLERLDLVVLTHEDADHIGGALTVLETLPADRLLTSLPRRHPIHGLAPSSGACEAGHAWTWDGVRFEFLHPPPGFQPTRRNDGSCVLRISNAAGSVLLTGDIERLGEAMLARSGALARSDMVLVPHHGSRTSSTPEFVAATSPRWAVVPVGYRNRFGHPNRDVLQRWKESGAELRRTDLEGAIRMTLGEEVRVAGERARRERYWLQ